MWLLCGHRVELLIIVKGIKKMGNMKRTRKSAITRQFRKYLLAFSIAACLTGVTAHAAPFSQIPDDNIVVRLSSGQKIDSGADFSVVKDALPGNITQVYADVTESETVGYFGDTELTIQSRKPTEMRTITAGAGMTAGNGAFFVQTDVNGTLTLNLSNVKFVGGKGATDSEDDYTGGAIFSEGDLVVTGTNVEFSGNSSEYGGALGAYYYDYNASENLSDISLTGSFTFSGNKSTEDGGAIYGGVVNISGTNVFAYNSAGDDGGAICGDEDIYISGTNQFINNSAVHEGGAIYGDKDIYISGTNQFINNSAVEDGGAIYAYDDIYISGTNEFTNNSAVENGGAIYGDYDVYISGTNQFINNSAEYGGAIYGYYDVEISGTNVFAKNSAKESGGAMWVDDNIYISGTNVFAYNSAGDDGGAIYGDEDVYISGINKFTNNVAGDDGAAIKAWGNLYLSGQNAFTYNLSTEDGGAINTGDIANISGTNVFSHNTAGEDGGAIASYYDIYISGNNAFANNTAADDGGAIYSSGDIYIRGTSEFSNNAAADEGGAIVVYDNVYFQGSGSIATFTGNKVGNDQDGWKQNDIFIREGNFDPGDSNGVHFSGAGTYFFGGGIDASNDGLLLEVADGANVTFGEGSITDVGGTFFTNNALVKIQGGTKTHFYAANVLLTDSLVNFEHSIAQAGKVLSTDNTSILESMPIVTLTDPGTKAIGYVSKVDTTGITTSVKNDAQIGTFNRLTYNPTTNGLAFDSSANALDELSAQSGDVLIATGDGQATAMQSFNGPTTLTVQSNSTEIRTITAGAGMTDGNGAFFAQMEPGATLSLNLSNVKFVGGKGAPDSDGDYTGGALFSAGDLAVRGNNVEFSGNSADYGGALGAYSDSGTQKITLTGSFIFSNNSANKIGGAIYAYGDVNISGTNVFANNSAVDDGGAIYGDYGVYISGTNKFVNNSAGDDGGAINAWDDINLSGTTEFINNSSGNWGGAIYGQYGPINISGSTVFANNTASEDGGAIYASDSLSFTGDGSVAIFEGNKVGNDEDGWKNNDIYAGRVSIQDAGTYFFGGGILAERLTIGSEEGGEGEVGPTVAFGENSVTEASDALVIQNATLGFEIGTPTVHEKTPYINAAGTEGGATEVVIANVSTFFTATDSYDGKGTTDVVLVEADADTDLSALQSNDQPYVDNNLWKITTALAESATGASQYIATIEGKDPGSRFGNGYAAMDLYTNEFYNNDYSDSMLRGLVNGSTGELFASAATAQVERINYINRTLANRLAIEDLPVSEAGAGTMRGQSGSCLTGRNVWVSGYGIGGDANMRHSFSGYDYNAGGSMFGMDWSSCTAKLGVYYGYGQTTMAAVASNLKSKDHTFGAYSNWENDWGYTTLTGGFSFSNADARRHDLMGPSTGEYDSWQANVYLEKGVRYQNEAGLVLNPYFSLQYVSYQSDDFNIGALNVGDVDFNSFRTILGMRLSKNFCAKWGMTQVKTGFSWNHELLDSDATFVASTTLPALRPRSTTVVGNGAGRDWFEYNVGVGVDLNARVNVSGDYFLMVNRYSTLNAGMGTVTVKF